MLLHLKKLNILNEGYGKTSISVENVYINPTHIISVRDYKGINNFLLKEGKEDLQAGSYCLVTLNVANSVEEMIVVGTSKQIHSSLQTGRGKELLNG